MTQINRVKVKGVKGRDMSVNDLCYLYYLMGKSALRSRREREAKAKAIRKGRER
jgi:hypothetical protein